MNSQIMMEERIPDDTTHQATQRQYAIGKLSMQGWMLRVESLAILTAVLVIYARYDFAWWMIPVLFLIPDLAMLGYLIGKRTGAIAYNLVHIYATPLAFGAVALLLGWNFGFQFALIWVLHIAVDRLLGYGLKYTDSFKHTHLDHV